MRATNGKHAWTVTMGEKGQIVIPKQARQMFDMNPGDTLIVLADEKLGLAIPPAAFFTQFTDEAFAQEEENEK